MNKKAWKLFKDKLPATLQLSGIFSAFILLVYGILYLCGYLINTSIFNALFNVFGIFDFILMVFIISFIVSILSPLIYSYFAANSVLDTKDEDKVNIRTFLKTYLLGMHHPIKGQLHIFSSLMWSFIVYLGLFFLILLVSFSIMSSTNYLGINEVFNHLKQLMEFYFNANTADAQRAALEEIIEFSGTPEFIQVVNFPLGYSNIISIFAAFYLFVHKIVINIFRYYPSTALGGVPAKPLNSIFRAGFKATKKQFYPNYYKTIWPLIILFVATFIGTYIGLSFVPDLTTNIFVLNITTIAITTIVLLPFLPVVFNLYSMLFPLVGQNYMEIFIQTAESQIQMVKQQQVTMNQVNEEQLNQAEKNIEKTRQMFEDFKSKNDTNDESNENKKSDDDKPSDEE